MGGTKRDHEGDGIVRPQDRDPPPATVDRFLRHWERDLEAKYGGRWRLRIDPDHAGEVIDWSADDA